ncbi:unnamed protein product [Dicrocoelium dendriticum]|nr:unnamed protein product [Dicrocoelium dendriticum]
MLRRISKVAMAQDRTQSLLTARVRPGSFYPRSSMTPSGLVEPRQTGLVLGHLPVPPIRHIRIMGNGSTDQQDRDYQVVSYGDLQNLLPEPKPSGRIEVGLLPDGRAYAPKTASREQYLLFPTKLSYILYFTHYYFSLENLSKDSTLLSMLIDRRTIPLDKLIQAPRLSAVNTTQDEAAQALVGSNIVCIEDMGNGVRGVSRRDKFPSEEPSLPYDRHAESDSPSKPFVPSTVHPITTEIGEIEQDAHNIIQHDATFDLKLNSRSSLPMVSFQASFDSQSTNRSVSSASEPMTTLVFSAASSCVPSSSRSPVSPPLTVNTSESSSCATVLPSVSLGCNRFAVAGWSHAQPAVFSGSQPDGTQPSALETSGPTYNTSIPGPHSYPSGAHLSSLSASEMSQMSFLPLRQPPVFGQYVMNQTCSTPFTYPPALAQVSSAGTPLNLAIAASMANQHHPIVSVSPFNSTMLGCPSHFGPHQANAALTAAYMAVAQQQQQQAAYLHATLPPGVHQHLHPFHSTTPAQPPTFPFYYSTQPIHLPVQFPRHSVQRPTYPLQAYPYYPTLLHNQIAVAPEVTGPLGKPETSGQFVTAGNSPQVPTSISYPILLQQQIQLPHANPLDSRLVAAAADLHLQRPTSVRHCVNAFGLAPSSMLLTNQPTGSANNFTIPEASHAYDPDTGTNVANEIELSRGLHTMNLHDERSGLSAPNTAVTYLPSSGSGMFSAPTTALCDDAPDDGITTTNSVHGISCEDSEDSASSGIGEMNSACSSSTSNARTTSSRTLTDNAIDADMYTPFNVCRHRFPTGCVPEPGSKT